MITWYLNGVRLLPQDLGILVYESSSQSGLYNVTTSELMILAAQQKHNGKVLCLARSTGAATDLGHDNQTSQLVVFGKLTLMWVFPNTGIGLISLAAKPSLHVVSATRCTAKPCSQAHTERV